LKSRRSRVFQALGLGSFTLPSRNTDATAVATSSTPVVSAPRHGSSASLRDENREARLDRITMVPQRFAWVIDLSGPYFDR